MIFFFYFITILKEFYDLKKFLHTHTESSSKMLLRAESKETVS